MLIRNHLNKYILALLDLDWNMVVIFGITVINEIRFRKNLEDFQLSIARTVTGAGKVMSHELISNELNWPSLTDRREC